MRRPTNKLAEPREHRQREPKRVRASGGEHDSSDSLARISNQRNGRDFRIVCANAELVAELL